MNNMLKRIISGITTLSMCAAIIGIIPASADDAPPEATSAKRPLTIEFMGVGNTPAATGKKSGNLTAENATNKDKFWIGIGVEKVNDLPLFTDGVYSLEVAFEYDPAYLRPDAQDGVTEEVKESTWNTDIKNVNTGSGNDWDEKYLVESVIETDLDTETDRANKDKLAERANWKMCTVCLTLTESDIANIRFKGLDSPDKQYLVKLPFTLISVPNEYAKDQNPIVLSLVRGPETFDIGSGNLGETPNAKWNETENQEAANNLKTYFDFQGDIKLFGEEQAITDITPFRNIPQKDEDGNPIKDAEDNILTEEETYELSQDENLNGGEFNPEVDTYYLRISNQPNNLQLRILSSELPTVTVNGTEVNVTLVDGNYVTDAFELNELEQNPDGTYKSDEFRNTIKVSAGGGTPYTIYVQRLLQPKIVLNYGNSPYGEIMRTDWTDEKKIEAKEKFSITNRYHVDFLPNSAIDKANILYTTRAWVDIANLGSMTEEENEKIANPNINFDRNDYAIFVYNDNYFRDPGFEAIDSLGNTITKINRKISVNRMTQIQLAGLQDKNQEQEDIQILDQTSDYLITEITKPYNNKDPKTRRIRPDIYYMEYSFEDSIEGTVTANRPVIVLQARGDTYCSGLINDSSVNPIYSYLKSPSSFDGITGSAKRIYFYKILDIDSSNLINDSDANPVYSYLKNYRPSIQLGITSVDNPLEAIYVELPNK